MSRNFILIQNLEAALADAIRCAREDEAKHGSHYKSAYRAGLEEVLKRSIDGEEIEIRYTTATPDR